MRFTRNKNKTTVNAIRIKNKFLWLPKSINGEFRWLEKASYLQRYEQRFDVTCGASWNEWVNVKWFG